MDSLKSQLCSVTASIQDYLRSNYDAILELRHFHTLTSHRQTDLWGKSKGNVFYTLPQRYNKLIWGNFIQAVFCHNFVFQRRQALLKLYVKNNKAHEATWSNSWTMLLSVSFHSLVEKREMVTKTMFVMIIKSVFFLSIQGWETQQPVIQEENRTS